MAATKATATFMTEGGITISKDIYVPDAAGSCGIDATGVGAASTSPTEWKPPINVTLIDLAILAAPTATRMSIGLNGALTGDCLVISQQLVTVAHRPPINKRIGAGSALAFINQT